MYDEIFKEDNLQFDLANSTISVRLTPIGVEIIRLLDPNGRFQPNADGYYDLFTSQLFTLYRSLLMRKSNAEISDLVDGPVLIPSTEVKDKDGNSMRLR